MSDLKKILMGHKIGGFPLFIMVLFLAFVFIAMYTGGLGGDMISTISFTLVLGLVLNAIGNQIPILNKYLGAGLLLCIFVPSYLVFKGVITEGVVDSTKNFFSFGGVQYLTFFIVVLMTNSMLNIDKKVLGKCIGRFIPLLLITVLGALGITVLVGVLLGVDVKTTTTEFVFPIMASGTSGAAALNQIFANAGGINEEAYFSSAVANVILATTLCIFFAILLNLIGTLFPKLTGDKKTLLRGGKGGEITEDKAVELPQASVSDVLSGLLLAGMVFVLSGVFSALIPSVKGIELHQYAYMVIILLILNITDVVPPNIKSGVKTLTTFSVHLLMPMICVCLGMTLMSWESFMSAFNPTTLILVLTCLASSCIVAGIFGHILGLFAVDSAITAALCQADMGGGADIAILLPSDRMGLIAYATVASRIGYAIVLILASIIFPIVI